MKRKSSNTVKLTGKCILCNKTEVLTDYQIRQAQISGGAISSCCTFPMTIIKADASFQHTK